jgi:hypothetical protein
MVFENRILRTIFCPSYKEQDSGKIFCDDLGSSFSLPNVTKGFKSRALKWARDVASMGKTKMRTKF